MTMTDPIADLLTRIRNVNALGRTRVPMPYSRMKEDVLATLKREGYIAGFSVEDAEVGKTLVVTLKYGPEGEKVINTLDRVSRPGRRVYHKIADLNKVLRGMGIWILSTPNGVLSDNEARSQNVGGEVLAKVY